MSHKDDLPAAAVPDDPVVSFEDYWRDAKDGCDDSSEPMLRAWASDAWNAALRMTAPVFGPNGNVTIKFSATKEQEEEHQRVIEASKAAFGLSTPAPQHGLTDALSTLQAIRPFFADRLADGIDSTGDRQTYELMLGIIDRASPPPAIGAPVVVSEDSLYAAHGFLDGVSRGIYASHSVAEKVIAELLRLHRELGASTDGRSA